MGSAARHPRLRQPPRTNRSTGLLEGFGHPHPKPTQHTPPPPCARHPGMCRAGVPSPQPGQGLHGLDPAGRAGQEVIWERFPPSTFTPRIKHEAQQRLEAQRPCPQISTCKAAQ